MKELLLFILGMMLLFPSAHAQKENEETGEKVLCGGVERWAIKVLTDPDAGAVNFIPVDTSINYLVHLSTPVSNSGDPRYPGIEDKTYRIICNITVKKFESDYDYHLILSDGTNTLIGEIPDPACAAASSSAYVGQFIAARNFIDAHIAFGDVYNINIPAVAVTGVAYVDIPHGQTGVAPNNIELHPVLNVQFASAIGINETKEELLSVNVSPNPFKEKLQVNVISKLNKLENCSLQLYDTRATLIAEYKLPVTDGNKISASIDSNVPAGAYIFRIINNGMSIYDGRLLKN